MGSHVGVSFIRAPLFEGALFLETLFAKGCLIGISEKSKGFGTFTTNDKGALRNFFRGRVGLYIHYI